MVRGQPVFVLSILLQKLEPMLREAAGVAPWQVSHHICVLASLHWSHKPVQVSHEDKEWVVPFVQFHCLQASGLWEHCPSADQGLVQADHRVACDA